MEKDFTKAYITEAFRLYARLGSPTYESAEEKIRAKVTDERPLEYETPTLLDFGAVEMTLDLLRQKEKDYITKAVKVIYFVQPMKPLRRGDITNRVRRFAITNGADERTVYRWLKEARVLCAAIRGLRVSKADTTKYLSDYPL